MPKENLTIEEKTLELAKYHALVLAILDYNSEVLPDSLEYFKSLKIKVDEHFKAGRLGKLKQWFRDFSEIQVETSDLKVVQYLKDKTGYDIDIFQSYFMRIESIIQRGKITSDNQFYDVNIMINQLSQTEPSQSEKLKLLDRLVFEYEQSKVRKR